MRLCGLVFPAGGRPPVPAGKRLLAAGAGAAMLFLFAFPFLLSRPAYGQDAPDFALSLPAAGAPSVIPGDGVNITLNLAASNGFNKRVSFRAEGLPAGATATFSPRSMAGAGVVTLHISTSSETPEGSFPIAISGVSGRNSVLSRNATVMLSVAKPAAKTLNVEITFYGFLDNSPPGKAIAFPVIHSEAGGKGTFSDPITFATDKAEIAVGTIVYVPFLKKYFIMEDDCVQCDTDFQASRKRHVDLWTGGAANSGQDLINCEDALTQNSASIVVNPANNLAVDTQQLFNSKTRKCFVP